ncbi:hypothetical protein [Pseudooceanicola nitratireducens]|nr:hypothetical protein [Pseudooceanicola nitratireducens]MBY6158388.1 hypothetical protein [Pseudooceanicola nitratireducens]
MGFSANGSGLLVNDPERCKATPAPQSYRIAMAPQVPLPASNLLLPMAIGGLATLLCRRKAA